MPYLYVIRLSPYTKLPFSLLPETISVSTGNNFQTYDVINVGEIVIPKGEKIRGVSWKGTLPGASRRNISSIHTEQWQDPGAITKLLDHWRQGYFDTRVMLTQSVINYVMKLKSFNFKPVGAHGDYEYEIAFSEKKEMKVRALASKKKGAGASSSSASLKAAGTKRLITTVQGDTLYRIALRELGDGSRYGEIKQLNESTLGSADIVPAGTKLTMP